MTLGFYFQHYSIKLMYIIPPIINLKTIFNIKIMCYNGIYLKYVSGFIFLKNTDKNLKYEQFPKKNFWWVF
jgi:hypothetical protein